MLTHKLQHICRQTKPYAQNQTGVKALILAAGIMYRAFGAVYGIIDFDTGLITGKTLTNKIGIDAIPK